MAAVAALARGSSDDDDREEASSEEEEDVARIRTPSEKEDARGRGSKGPKLPITK